jgi:hypothetical protein
MAAKGATFNNDLLKLIFNGTAIADIAEDDTSSPLTNLYVSLHTGTLTASSNQTTTEAAYTDYARVAVARTSGGWTVSTNTVVPAATISFPAASGGSETETYFGIGTASSGTGKLLYWGPISPTIAVSTGVTPQLTTGTTITEA